MLHKRYIRKFVFYVSAEATTERHGARTRMEHVDIGFGICILYGELSTMQRNNKYYLDNNNNFRVIMQMSNIILAIKHNTHFKRPVPPEETLLSWLRSRYLI